MPLCFNQESSSQRFISHQWYLNCSFTDYLVVLLFNTNSIYDFYLVFYQMHFLFDHDIRKLN
jgi:hypothetical protein